MLPKTKMRKKCFDEPNVYFILNKPYGVVCSKVSDRHQVIYDLFARSPFFPELSPSQFERLHSVGRLDSDSTGLLLLTTDGKLTHFLESPENHVEKIYSVTLANPVRREFQESYVGAFRNGIFVPALKKSNEFVSGPCMLEFTSECECYVKISEGKFRQIRRMFACLGNEVTGLKRTAIGKLKLDGTEEGKIKQLSYKDIEKLFLDF